MRHYFFYLIALGLTLNSLELSAQSRSPLQVESNWFKMRFSDRDSNHYKLSELIPLFEGHGRAEERIRKANNQHDLSRFCLASGAFLGIYPVLGQAFGRDANYSMSLVGLALMGAAIPLEISSRKLALEAVLLYNQGLKKPKKISLGMACSPQGIGLRLRF